MDLHRNGWLSELISAILADYRPERALGRMSALARGEGAGAGLSPRIRGLRHLDEELRRSGLIYGSPKLPSRVTQGRRFDRADAFFLSVVAAECFVALDIGRIYGIPFDAERSEVVLTTLLAVGAGRVDLATMAARHLRPRDAPARPTARSSFFLSQLRPSDRVAFGRVQARVEAAVVSRMILATGDTLFDLPVHNGLVYSGARTIGRLAIDLHRTGRFRPTFARRLLAAARRERAQLLPALVAPARLVRAPSDQERRAIALELRTLRIPRDLLRQVRSATETVPLPGELARTIRPRATRRFALEQAWLSSMIGGIDESEARYLSELAAAFDFSDDELEAIEAEIAEYFFDPEDIYDAFEIRAKGQGASEKLLDRIEREIAENMDKIALEVKETGELTQLLAKVAMGQRLTPREREKAREQLLDLAKVVPSLAIIAAPGGTLIFAVLLKVLPFSILPSSFQKRPETRPRPRRQPRFRARSRRPTSS